MFIELAGDNCACGFLFWSRIPTQAGLANTCTVGYLGGVLGAKILCNELAGANCAMCMWVLIMVPNPHPGWVQWVT